MINVSFNDFNKEEKEYLEKYQKIFVESYKDTQKLNARIDVLNLDYNNVDTNKLINIINNIIHDAQILPNIRIDPTLISFEYIESILSYYHFYCPKLSFRFPSKTKFIDMKYKDSFLLINSSDGLIRFFKYDGNNFCFIKELGIKDSICSAYEIFNHYFLYAVESTLYLYNLKSGKIIKKRNMDQNITQIHYNKIEDNIVLYFDKNKQEFKFINDDLISQNISSNISDIIENKSYVIIDNLKLIIQNGIIYTYFIDSIVDLKTKNNNKISLSNQESILIIENDINTIFYYLNLPNITKKISKSDSYEISKDDNLLEITSSSEDKKVSLYYKNEFLLESNSITNTTFSNDSKSFFFINENKKSFSINSIENILLNKKLDSSKSFPLSSYDTIVNKGFSSKDRYFRITYDTGIINSWRKIELWNYKVMSTLGTLGSNGSVELKISNSKVLFLDDDKYILIWGFSSSEDKNSLYIYETSSYKLIKSFIYEKDTSIYKYKDSSIIITNSITKSIDLYLFLDNDLVLNSSINFPNPIDKPSINDNYISVKHSNQIDIYNIKTSEKELSIYTCDNIKDFYISKTSDKLYMLYENCYEVYDLNSSIKKYNLIPKNISKDFHGYIKFDQYISIFYLDKVKTFKFNHNGANFIYEVSASDFKGEFKLSPSDLDLYVFEDGFIIISKENKVYGSENWKDYIYFVDGDEIKDYPKWESYYDSVWDFSIFEEL